MLKRTLYRNLSWISAVSSSSDGMVGMSPNGPTWQKKKRIVLRQQLFLLVCLSSSALPKIGLRTRGSDEFRTRDVGAESWGKNMGFHRSILRFGRSVSRASPVILRRIRNLWRGIISGEPKPQTLNLRPEPSRNLQDTNPCSMCHQIIRDDGTDSPPA